MPPVGWAELHGEIGGLRAEIQRDMRMQAYSLIAAVAALNGAMLAIVRL